MVPGQPGPSQRAAAFQAQAQPQKSPSHSIIMPIYTFGVVAFFVFTIVKILMKKAGKEPLKRGMPTESDPKFTERVFNRKNEQAEKDKKKKLGE
jgi:hypothetical protein